MSTWIRIDDTMPDNPKIVAAGGAAAWLYTCSIAYSSRNLTDGFIPTGIAPRLTDFDNTAELAARLVSNGLWKTVEGGWLINDYTDYQRTAAEVEEIRSEARERQARSRSGKATRALRATDMTSPQATAMSQACHSDVTRDKRVTGGDASHGCHSEVTEPPTPTPTQTHQPPYPPVDNQTITDHPSSGGGGGTTQLTAVDIANAAAHALAQTTPGINNPTAWTRTVTARLTRDHPDITDLANRNGPNAAIAELVRRETQTETTPSRPTTSDLEHAARRWAHNIHHQHHTGPNGTSTTALLEELDHATRHMPADEALTWHNTALATYQQLTAQP